MVDLRVGAALETLPLLASEGAGDFDFVFIDADKINTPAYFVWALDHTRPGGLIFADNVIRGGTIADPDGDECLRRPAGLPRDTRRRAAGERDDDPDRRVEGLRRLHPRVRAWGVGHGKGSGP